MNRLEILSKLDDEEIQANLHNDDNKLKEIEKLRQSLKPESYEKALEEWKNNTKTIKI